eukprot:9734_1
MAQATYHCTLCDKYNTTHKPMHCPSGVQLSHGTRVSNMSPISKQGLLPSKGGRLGAGIYLTTPQHARAIAALRGQGTGTCVMHCQVALGGTKDNGRANDGQGSWRNNYDSCKGLHPRWANCPEFPEWCLKNPQKCVIREVELVDGTVDGDIHLPGVTIRIKGTCTFRGNITAGHLIIG